MILSIYRSRRVIVWELILLSMLVELFEVYWQRSDTLLQSLAKGYSLHKKSIFLLLIMHPSYLYTLFVCVVFEIYNWAIVLILLLKSLDMVVKISLIEKIFVKKNIGIDMQTMLEGHTPLRVYLIALFTYPYLMYVALSMSWSYI